jgi:hypothetical protein
LACSLYLLSIRTSSLLLDALKVRSQASRLPLPIILANFSIPCSWGTMVTGSSEAPVEFHGEHDGVLGLLATDYPHVQ